MPKVGYVAIVGRPNARKSTFLNALIGERISAISPRPQTTVRSIPGIFTDEEKNIQIIFLDTPGIHHDGIEQYGSQKVMNINNRINSEAFASLRNADVIIHIIDPTRPKGSEDTRIDEVLSFAKQPILCIETKQDLNNKPHSRPDIDIKIDSINKIGFEGLIEKIAALLPEGPYLYEPDYYTDQSVDLRIQEIIREQLFAALGEEIPYACYVEIGSLENTETILKIQAYINTETDSQKTIVIGKGGQKINAIGMQSRLVLEEIFGKKVFLGLRVKVHKNWRKNEHVLNKLFPKK